MGLGFLQELPVWANAGIFVVMGAVIWVAGSRLSRHTSTISRRTGASEAFLGVLLLGGVTSLPEAATTASAALLGNPELAVNNVFGGVALQVVVLAVADATAGRYGISVGVRSPTILLQAALGVLVLMIASAGILLGDVGVLGTGVWTTAVFVVAVTGVYLIKRYEAEPRWEPVGVAEQQQRMEEAEERKRSGRDSPEGKRPERPLSRVVLAVCAAGAAILVAGYVVARTGEVLAEQTGLGSSFVGAILVAASTSLPEVSTTIAAVRVGAAELALSNIFGTNLFDLGFLFLADVLYRDGLVLATMGPFSLFAALLAATLTTIYVIGLIEREDRRVLGMGIDSAMVMVVYLGGVYGMWTLR